MGKMIRELVKAETALSTIHIEIEGVSAMLMSDVKAANEFHPLNLRLRELTAMKKNKAADKEAIAAQMREVELRLRAYYKKDLGFYVPGRSIMASLKEGAKLSRNGKNVERGVMPFFDTELNHNGPLTLNGLVEDDDFIHSAIVVIGRAKVMRHRPMFPTWSFQATIRHDANMIDKDTILSALAAAGSYCGIGDGRALGFGRYNVYELTPKG